MRDSFLKYLQYEKRYSQHTLVAYEGDLKKLEEFLTDHGLSTVSTEEATHNDLREWIYHLREEGNDPRSVNRRIATLRTYYKFLLRNHHMEKDPSSKLRALKTGKKLPDFVSEADMMGMLDKIIFEDSFEGYRDRLILELLYGTGIRLSELLSLKFSRINTHERTVKVLGKRNKERVIPIPKGLTSLITAYQKKRTFEGIKETDLVIVTKEGDPGYPMMVYRTVRRYLDEFTTLDKRSPHVLRHTFATHLVNKGAELNAVKDLLGHANLAATQVYTHNTFDRLKSVYDQAHPKA
jgi:integrase/recombinase XerC